MMPIGFPVPDRNLLTDRQAHYVVQIAWTTWCVAFGYQLGKTVYLVERWIRRRSPSQK